MGLEGVEFDVFVTTDERVVVFHDRDTERLTGTPGDITKMSSDEVSKLRLQKHIPMGKNAKGEDVVVHYPSEEPIPLLEEVLAEFKGKLAMNVELKPPSPRWWDRHVGRRVAEVIRKTEAQDSVIVTSFDFLKLDSLEDTFPELHSGFAYDDNFLDFGSGWLRLLPELPSEIAEAQGNQNPETVINWLLESNVVGQWIHSTVADIEHTLIDSNTVDKLHEDNIKVGTYTLYPLDTTMVKKPLSDTAENELARRLVEAKVDWIETDDPKRLLDLMNSL
jgi:glycerophosphoryl diester phosphodiesterase